MPLPVPSQITLSFSNYKEHPARNLFIVTQGVFESYNTNLSLVKDKLPLFGTRTHTLVGLSKEASFR